MSPASIAEELTLQKFSLEQREEILIATLSTGGKINQFSPDVLQELQQLMKKVEETPSVKAVIFTGKDKALAAGANIQYMSGLSAAEGYKLAELGQESFNAVERCSKLTIAANNGVAVGGGCELGLACDLRLAVENGKYGQPEVNLGLIPGWGGSRRLMRYIGQARALELILTARLISSEEALQIGLINKVVPADKLLEEAIALAKEVTNKSAIVIDYAKRAFRAGYTANDRDAELAERELFGKCFDLEDAQEGMQAFLEKRPANFQDR